MNGDRLKQELIKAKITQGEFAETMGVSPNTIWRWCAEKVDPSDKMKKKIAKELGVSIAYLMGESVGIPSYPDISLLVAERIKSLRLEKDISQEELSRQCNLPLESVRKWEDGESSPNSFELWLLAKTLNSTVMFLSGEIDYKEAPIHRIKALMEEEYPLPQRIQKRRKTLQLNYHDILRLTGIPESSTKSWELGEEHPNITNLIKIKEVFYVSIGYLMGEVPFPLRIGEESECIVDKKSIEYAFKGEHGFNGEDYWDMLLYDIENYYEKPRHYQEKVILNNDTCHEHAIDFAYWGQVVDNALKISKEGDLKNLNLIAPLLKAANDIIETAIIEKRTAQNK